MKHLLCLLLFLSSCLLLSAQCPEGQETVWYNAIVNSDFSKKNTAFQSDFRYTDSLRLLAGQYSVKAKPKLSDSAIRDHSTGIGYLLLAKPDSLSRCVWRQKQACDSSKSYQFELWYSNVRDFATQFCLFINQKEITCTELSGTAWQKFQVHWTAKGTDSIEIELFIHSKQSGILLLDDISLFLCREPRLSVLSLGNEECILGEDFISEAFQFAQSSVELSSSAQNLLDEVQNLMQRTQTLHIFIEGHTSDEGEADKNDALSLARAEACREYLIQKGIAKERIRIEGHGERFPLYDNQNPLLRKKNRRIVLRFFQKF